MGQKHVRNVCTSNIALQNLTHFKLLKPNRANTLQTPFSPTPVNTGDHHHHRRWWFSDYPESRGSHFGLYLSHCSASLALSLTVGFTRSTPARERSAPPPPPPGISLSLSLFPVPRYPNFQNPNSICWSHLVWFPNNPWFFFWFGTQVFFSLEIPDCFHLLIRFCLVLGILKLSSL